MDYESSMNGKKTSKYIKAEQLILQGAKLKIISETKFLSLIKIKEVA